MAKNYLVETKGNLYFRMKVPAQMRNHFPSQEIKCSLKGMDLKTAQTRSILLATELTKLFQRASRGLVDMAFMYPLVKRFCSVVLFRDQFTRHTEGDIPEIHEGWDEIYLDAYRNKGFYSPFLCEFMEYAKRMGEEVDWESMHTEPMIKNFYLIMSEVSRIRKERAVGNLRNGFDEADEHGRFSKIFPPEDFEPVFPGGIERYCSDKRVAGTDIEKFIQSKRSPGPAAMPPAPPMSMPAAAPELTTPEKKITLQYAIDAYINEKITMGTWDKKNTTMQRSILGILSEHFGSEKELTSIKRQDMLNLLENVLKRYPKSRSKRFPGKSLEEIWKTKFDPIQTGTINNYLEYMTTFFNWCVKVDYLHKAPLGGVGIKRNDKEEDLKPPFTDEELALIFTNFATYHRNSKIYIHRFWVPLLLLYQGCRLNDICQLYLKDIFTVDGIPCIRITDDKEYKQTVKNKFARRIVPIHHKLLELDFLGFYLKVAKSSTKKGRQLFPGLTYTEHHKYTRNMQGFNDFAHSLVSDNSKSLHSLRHNAMTGLMNVEDNQFLVECIGGYSRKGVLSRRYAKGQLSAMRETLNKLDYEFDIFKALKKTPLSTDEIDKQIKRLPVYEDK